MTTQLPSFDDLMKMAQDNPEQLEELRQQLCDQVIASAPEVHRRRLRGLQFQIDMQRRRAKNPMAACMKISGMMHESFGELRDALNDLKDVRSGKAAIRKSIGVELPESAPADTGKVIRFPGK